MYMLHPEFSDFDWEEFEKENKPLIVIGKKTLVRFAGDERTWKIRKQQAEKEAVYLIASPKGITFRSKKADVGVVPIPNGSSFKNINGIHLGINFRDNQGRLRVIIMTCTAPNRLHKTHVKEIFLQ